MVNEYVNAHRQARVPAKVPFKMLHYVTGSTRRAVSRQEAGAMPGVSWKTIERLVNRGELRGLKVLGQWRVMVSEVGRWCRTNGPCCGPRRQKGAFRRQVWNRTSRWYERWWALLDSNQ
ncbi:MAG: hypothetical protein NTW87_04565 [Planctomycetota bacterium]|nr:hypothetical protein [Planctomycetota bacterium]